MKSDGLVDGKEASNPSDQSEAVSAPVGCLAIVFTDIEHSTGLWETWPGPMRKAMTLHDQVLRAHLETYRGYEVKTIGDGYLVAFASASHALQWCFDVQEGLINSDWPSEVLQSPHAARVHDEAGNMVFAGLSVRMSAHWGTPICVTNMVTRRMDYIGPMIHRPARAIDLAKGGQIVTTRAFFERVRAEYAKEDSLMPRDGRSLSGTAVADLGEHQLKGLATSLQLFSFLPRSLVGRLEHFPDDAMGRPIDAFSTWRALLTSERFSKLRMSQSNMMKSSSKPSFNPGRPHNTGDTLISEGQAELTIGLSSSREIDYTEVVRDDWNEPLVSESDSQSHGRELSDIESGESSAYQDNVLNRMPASMLLPSLAASHEMPLDIRFSRIPGAFFAASATSNVDATDTTSPEVYQTLLGMAHELAHGCRHLAETTLQEMVAGLQNCLRKLQSAEMGLFLMLLAFVAIFVGMALNVVGTLQPWRQ